MTFDFEEAQKGGMGEASIRMYLREKGRENEADEYFGGGKTPGPAGTGVQPASALNTLPPMSPEDSKDDKSVGGFIGNIFSSGADLIGGVTQAALNPIDTLKNVGSIAVGGAQKLIPGEQKQEQNFDALTNFFKERYGSLDAVKETLYSDPIGVVGDLSSILGVGGGVLKLAGKAGKIAGVGEGASTASKIGNAASVVGKNIDPLNIGASAVGKIGGKLKAGAEAVSDPVTNKIKTIAEESSIDPRTKAFLTSDDPVIQSKNRETYNKYSNQEELYKTATSNDTAVEFLGSEIGDSYKTVIDKRRKAGAVKGDELEKISNIQADVNPDIQAFEDEISKVTTLKRMTTAEVGMIDEYKVLLKELGPTPELGDLDAFMTRTPNEINIYKNKNSVTNITNAERLITDNLANMRKQFDPVHTKNDKLTAYSQSRTEYSRLTKLLKEGEGILGKKSELTGDYTHDASLAKSSIKSIHAGNKRGFLEELGKEVGKDFIKDGIIAIQAMKDAGNFKQASLLENLVKNVADGGVIPTSAAGAVGALLKGAVEKGIGAVAGSPEEITRQIISPMSKSTTVKKTSNVRKYLRTVKNQGTKATVINRSQEEAGL